MALRPRTHPWLTSQSSPRTGRRAVTLAGLATALICPLALSAVAAAASTGASAAPVAAAAGSPLPVMGPGVSAGAHIPGMAEYLAVGRHATTNGSVTGPDYTEGSLASEAVGREAVQLTAPGQYVQFKLTQPANAIDVDYALAQGAAGTLSVYVNGQRIPRKLQLTAKYSYISTPNITGSMTHHFFDDARLLLHRELCAGATVRLQVNARDTATPYTIDLLDTYQVAPPRPQPAGSVSVTSLGADPTGHTDSTAAFNAAVSAAAAAHESVWLPPGHYLIGSPLQVNSATIEGAGAWYSVILSNEFIDNTSVVPGPVNLSDFAIQGSTIGRHDDSTANAINGSLGTGSAVHGLWIQNTNVGLWLEFGNTRLRVTGNVILDTDADGINLNGNAVNVTASGNFVRNTGDDGLAIWSYPAADSHDSFLGNTVEETNLANGIAEYGGTDNTISNNVIADTNALGSGLTISNEQFLSPGFTPLAGRITVSGNRLIRTGAMNPNWGHPMSAIQVDSYDYAISGVTIMITDTTVLDTPYSVFELVCGDGTGLPIHGLKIERAHIDHVGTVVFQAETAGSAYVSGVRAANVGVAGTVQDQYPPGTASFTIHTGPDNQGWGTTPVLPYFPNPIPPVP
ncbi:MAG TPA: glycosyl hydrolase family 28-related protein [Streptosporangiaceae bacterium]|nr:glycosyl hydrolase family 28-related protein [Streptosporangiaceae bacterium]